MPPNRMIASRAIPQGKLPGGNTGCGTRLRKKARPLFGRDLLSGIDAVVDGLKWGTSFHGTGWCPRHIEGTDHFLFYTLEKQTGKKFLHGQPVGLGIIVGSMLHGVGADQMMDAIAGIGLDVRPEAMGLHWHQAEAGLTGMRSYIKTLPLWHSLAHDTDITPGFIKDLKQRLDLAYAKRT